MIIGIKQKFICASKVLLDWYFLFTHQAHLFFHFFGLRFAHRIVEAVHTDPENKSTECNTSGFVHVIMYFIGYYNYN